jgi:hypothetical protein
MKFGKYFIVLLAAFFISSCDNESSHNKHQVGNVKIVNNEAVLIGEGVIRLKGVTVRVGMSALYVNGDDYGSVPGGARTVLRVHDNGSFEIFVNDEKRYKSAKKNSQKPNQSTGSERIKNFNFNK